MTSNKYEICFFIPLIYTKKNFSKPVNQDYEYYNKSLIILNEKQKFSNNILIRKTLKNTQGLKFLLP